MAGEIVKRSFYGNAIIGPQHRPEAEPDTIDSVRFDEAEQKRYNLDQLKYLDSREAERLHHAPEYRDASHLPEIFQKGGLYKFPAFSYPLYEKPNGEIHTARSTTYVSFKLEQDGSMTWKIIANPMVTQIKPFYYREGSFDKDFVERFQKGTYTRDADLQDDTETSDLGEFTNVIGMNLEDASTWGAILFNYSMRD